MKNTSFKKKSHILLAFVVLSFSLAAPQGFAADIAELVKAWDDYTASLSPFLPQIKLQETVNTTGHLVRQKETIRKLVHEPFLTVESFDFSTIISKRIANAQKNIITLKDNLAAVKVAHTKYQEAFFGQMLDQIDTLATAQKQVISQNLKLYPDIFQLYYNIDKPGGDIELINKRIVVLKAKIASQQKASEAPLAEYRKIWATLQTETAEAKVDKVIVDLSMIDNTMQIPEFIKILNDWSVNPQHPLSASQLDLLIDRLSEIFNEEITTIPPGAVEKVYLIEESLKENLTTAIGNAVSQRENIQQAYKNYRDFLQSEKLFYLLDKNVTAEDLIPSYVVDGRIVAQGWQAEGTWDYPLFYKVSGVRENLYSLEKQDEILEVINVENAVTKYFKDLEFLSKYDNISLTNSLKKLIRSIETVERIQKDINKAVSLLKDDERKEKAVIEEKSVIIDQLVTDALARYEKIRDDIAKGVYLQTGLNEFREMVTQEQKLIAELAEEVFLIYPEILAEKAKEALQKLRTLIQLLFTEFSARKSRQFEGEYNEKLAAQIKEMQQKFTAFLQLKDAKKVAKEYRLRQKELRHLKRGNTKITKNGETLVIERSEENQNALKKLEEQVKQVTFHYYKTTTAPTLSAVKLDGEPLLGASITLKEGKTTVILSGKTSVNYAASKNGFSVTRVRYSLDDGQTYQNAEGQTEWQFSLTLKPHSTTNLAIQAVDSANTFSKAVSVTFTAPALPTQDAVKKEDEKTSDEKSTPAEAENAP